MIATIHQPEHLIWLGLIDKISRADVFVILDTVQFRKNYYQNRNKIRINAKEGWAWITVPTKKQPLKTKIEDIEISNIAWKEHYLALLEINYSITPSCTKRVNSLTLHCSRPSFSTVRPRRQ